LFYLYLYFWMLSIILSKITFLLSYEFLAEVLDLYQLSLF